MTLQFNSTIQEVKRNTSPSSHLSILYYFSRYLENTMVEENFLYTGHLQISNSRKICSDSLYGDIL